MSSIVSAAAVCVGCRNIFFFSSRRRHTRLQGDWSSDVCSSDLAYRTVRCCASPLVDFRGRPLPDIIFPILNSSQNWFAEMLLKILGRELKGEEIGRASCREECRSRWSPYH